MSMKCHICHKRIWYPFQKRTTFPNMLFRDKKDNDYHIECFKLTNAYKLFHKNCKKKI